MNPYDSGGRTPFVEALQAIAAGAQDLDRSPAFPERAFEKLSRAGTLASTIGSVRNELPVKDTWDLVRQVAAADASVGRIFDGHLNAVERLEISAEPAIRDAELEKVQAGNSLLGVWGADPSSLEGKPARLIGRDGDQRLTGVKTFCSGAGGIDSAMVMVGNDDGEPPRLVLVECDDTMEIDRSWYRAAGLRASESHRVSFHETVVVAIIGEPGELVREPWFSRDALRTAASWAGMADAAADSALEYLAERRADEPLSQLAAGRIESARGTIDAWLGRTAAAVDAAEDLKQLSVLARFEIADAARRMISEAERACGSHPFVTGAPLDRARRDLETFLLQHRLDPMLTRLGAGELRRR